MHTMRFYHLLLLLTCSCVVISLPIVRFDSSIQSCGRNLADILDLACRDRGGLHGPGTVGVSSKGRSEGVADECCVKPCSWRTIISYCVNSTIEEDLQPTLPPNFLQRKVDEDEIFGSDLQNLVFAQYAAPKRRSKKAGCDVCQCKKRTRKADRNRMSNNLNVGTVPPDLARPPVVVRKL